MSSSAYVFFTIPSTFYEKEAYPKFKEDFESLEYEIDLGPVIKLQGEVSLNTYNTILEFLKDSNIPFHVSVSCYDEGWAESFFRYVDEEIIFNRTDFDGEETIYLKDLDNIFSDCIKNQKNLQAALSTLLRRRFDPSYFMTGVERFELHYDDRII